MAKNTDILNLVDDSSMVEAGALLYNAMVKNAPYQHIKNAVYLSRVQGSKNSRFITVSIDLKSAPDARAFDLGSGMRGKFNETYPIKPVSKPLLIFQGTNGFAGKLIFTKLVNHPGVAGTGYTKKAMDEVKKPARAIIAAGAKDKIKAYLRSSFTKLGEK